MSTIKKDIIIVSSVAEAKPFDAIRECIALALKEEAVVTLHHSQKQLVIDPEKIYLTIDGIENIKQ